MNKYFLEKQKKLLAFPIPREDVEAYRVLLIAAMREFGATDEELSLIGDGIIRNSIRKNRKPEDVAWAILQ